MIKRFIAFTVISAAFFVLLGLGIWQMQRMAWKNEIVEGLRAAYQTPAQDMALTYTDLEHPETQPFLYGQVGGTLYPDKTIFAGPRTYEGKIGYIGITPLKMETGFILVNRGWISVEGRESFNGGSPQPAIVSGMFRAPDWNRFTPENSPENNVWTKLDISQMARAMNVNPVSPYLLYASEMEENEAFILQTEHWYPRNKHAQYAAFWFTMAFALIVLCGMYIYQKRKTRS
jgi:surfeit locus 1 family protein